VAAYRAQETSRPDALFRDPYAARLAGERGEQIAALMPFQAKNAWPFMARTILFDTFVTQLVKDGVDSVINLAAGLDARPYRMALPPTLKWFEVDLPGILDYKEEILKDEKPVCVLERIRLDLSNVNARRDLFAELGRKTNRALILTEGLIGYMSADEVGSFARDLTAPASFQHWVNDFGSPGLLKMLQKSIGPHLSAASSPLKFGPPEGPAFFTPFGWKPVDVQNVLKIAGRFKRLPFFLQLMSFLPSSDGRQGGRPWSAVCLFARG
jgi:methyltransferase (TIGR00027 family)